MWKEKEIDFLLLKHCDVQEKLKDVHSTGRLKILVKLFKVQVVLRIKHRSFLSRCRESEDVLITEQDAGAARLGLQFSNEFS